MLTDVACRDEDVPKTCLVSLAGTVGDIFQIGEWFGIGVGDARTVVLQAKVDKLLWGEFIVSDVRGGDL